MHPGISEFPSETFYEKRLQDGISFRDRPSPKGIFWPDALRPIVFYNVMVSAFFAVCRYCVLSVLYGISHI